MNAAVDNNPFGDDDFFEKEPAPAPVAAPKPKSEAPKPKSKAPVKSVVPKIRKPKEEPLPKKPTTVEEWLEAKVRAPSRFTVDENGDLVIPPYKAGESEVTIVHRASAPATADHILKHYKARNEALKEPEAEYAEAKRNVQTVYAAYKREAASIDEVLQANENVRKAEIKINSLVKYPRNFEELQGLLVNDLNFDWYRRTKIPVPVGTMQSTVFPWKVFWTAAPDVIPDFDEADYFGEEGMAGGAKPKRDLTAQQRAIIANIRKRKMGGF